MKKYLLASLLIHIFIFTACKKAADVPAPVEDALAYTEVGSIDLGDLGASEISAYDAGTKKLFVVNNSTVNKIDVVDLSNPSIPVFKEAIALSSYGGFVNSLSVHEGKLAAAIEAVDKQASGKVVVFNTTDLAEVKVIPVGSLPDMITYSPDGKYILTANEGEPSGDYTNDPSGTVSVITTADYSVVNIDFSSLSSQLPTLTVGGFRVFGIGNNFVKDIEPEYVAVSPDSKTAWVTLQENNGIAKIDLTSKTVIGIFPLGFKNYNLDNYRMDISDRDNAVSFTKNWNVKGMFQPDAIAMVQANIPLLFTANEGDAREYTALTEVKRIKDVSLDPIMFPNSSVLKQDANMGRLNITTTKGDTDGDGDFDELYSLGARSFSIWNGNTGALIYDSKNELDARVAADGLYDDGRSDDKGCEPEGLTIGQVGNRTILFIGLERADALIMYDITNPYNPVFIKTLKTGDGPEGVLFIPAAQSPNGKSLLLVSNENDGVVKVYAAGK
jgi:DNA-binding beta-propeller fold protein YncE